MRITSTFLTSMATAGACAIAVAAAPLASADPATAPAPPQPHQACTTLGGNVCQSPGNAQINDAPPPVQFYPYGGGALLL